MQLYVMWHLQLLVNCSMCYAKSE